MSGRAFGRLVWLSCAILAAGLAACQESTTAPGVTVTAPTSVPGVTPSSLSEAIPSPQVLLDLSGRGPITTSNFVPSQEWDLDWRYDCSGITGSPKFSVTLYEADRDVVAVLVNVSDRSGAAVAHQRQIDNYYLGINSPCPWHVQVRG